MVKIGDMGESAAMGIRADLPAFPLNARLQDDVTPCHARGYDDWIGTRSAPRRPQPPFQLPLRRFLRLLRLCLADEDGGQ
jgi:hypothetical protein